MVMDQLPNRLKMLLQKALLHPKSSLHLSSTSSPSIRLEKIASHTHVNSNDVSTHAQRSNVNGHECSLPVITNESDMPQCPRLTQLIRGHSRSIPSTPVQTISYQVHPVHKQSSQPETPTLPFDEPFLYHAQPLPATASHHDDLYPHTKIPYSENSSYLSVEAITNNTPPYDDLEAQPSNFGQYFLSGPPDDELMNGGVDFINEQLDGLFEDEPAYSAG